MADGTVAVTAAAEDGAGSAWAAGAADTPSSRAAAQAMRLVRMRFPLVCMDPSFDRVARPAGVPTASRVGSLRRANT
ncbi:hypothetical protein GCM10009654_54720 [Streptomyces hebeiensis]|uniref:Uncharacterized protein n=1 Tax=Streptomyces hebeiensis TaxID=229486 RepID=A0ABP4FLU8_9ACTN